MYRPDVHAPVAESRLFLYRRKIYPRLLASALIEKKYQMRSNRSRRRAETSVIRLVKSLVYVRRTARPIRLRGVCVLQMKRMSPMRRREMTECQTEG